MNVNHINLALPLAPVQLHLTTLDPAAWSHLHTRFGIEAFPLLEGDDPRLSGDAAESANEAGASVWRFERSGEGGVDAVLAWDWIVLPGDIVVRKNVQQVATNIELVAEDSSTLRPPLPTLVFASLIHGLPWHEFVLREISGQRTRN